MTYPKTPKTFSFCGRIYKISVCDKILGMTDVPAQGSNEWNMLLVKGAGFDAFHAHLHEALEAFGVPSDVLHDKNGSARTQDIARFLWKAWIAPLKHDAKHHISTESEG